ncbi:NADH dehydrogenase [ubiquinone] 1 beta subcomplex subunit 2 [Phtheirospermum japonicum]|uniref:NADH dehydrogenase [ubiquinone] 1 beta subcomplex subunit 2 n=1 Tax=Phtheirospermum japonicum TaxID=374723 RepID=A0A830B566_9LAMI|nr:NADH dehydrogenase [ubiquinone] 1 beta subcomplex subunit 2 [Phtheirospermum japonicum]
MGGAHGDGITYKGVTLHKPKRWHTVTGKGLCAVMWFWVFYRAKQDGPVVLLPNVVVPLSRHHCCIISRLTPFSSFSLLAGILNLKLEKSHAVVLIDSDEVGGVMYLQFLVEDFLFSDPDDSRPGPK